MTTTTVLALVATVAIVVALVFLVRLHTAPTGLDPTRDAVSAYGISAYHLWYRAMVLTIGAGALVLTAALATLGAVPAGGLAALAVYGAARLAIAPFPTDPEDATPTTAGRLHVLFAVTGFLAIAVAAPIISGALAELAGWRGIGGLLRVLGVLVSVTCALVLAAGLLPRLRPRFGAFQRAFYVAGQAWLLVVAIRLAWPGA